MENWKIVMSTEDTVELSVATALLNEREIPNNTISKRDSAYVMIGFSELYVPDDFADQAEKVLATMVE